MILLLIPVVTSALFLALAVVRSKGRKVAAPTREEIREHDAYLLAWRINRDRRRWERELGIPAFGQKKAPAETRAEVCRSRQPAGAMLFRRRTR